MRSGPNFFGDCTQSGPESQDRTVSQSRPDWTAKSYFGPVSKFGTGLLTNRSGPVRSQSLGPVRSVYLGHSFPYDWHIVTVVYCGREDSLFYSS